MNSFTIDSFTRSLGKDLLVYIVSQESIEVKNLKYYGSNSTHYEQWYIVISTEGSVMVRSTGRTSFDLSDVFRNRKKAFQEWERRLNKKLKTNPK